ncbi:MAG: RNA pseudouridine synthase, partial [Mucinivorans sp.]
MKQELFVATKEASLLDFLFESFGTLKSKTTIKSYLAHRQVSLQGCVTTKFDRPVKVGDEVIVHYGRQKEALRHPMLR